MNNAVDNSVNNSVNNNINNHVSNSVLTIVLIIVFIIVFIIVLIIVSIIVLTIRISTSCIHNLTLDVSTVRVDVECFFFFSAIIPAWIVPSLMVLFSILSLVLCFCVRTHNSCLTIQ